MLHSIAARQAARASRGGLRAGAQTARASAASAVPRIVAQRMASSSTQAATKQVKSDAPWAIGSVVIFGGLFVFLTSPKKGGHGHGHDDHHDKKPAKAAAPADDDEEEESEEAPADSDSEEEQSSASSDDGSEPSDSEGAARGDGGYVDVEDDDGEYMTVKKIEGKPGKDAPSGAQALAERSLTAEEGAHLQKPTKQSGPNPKMRYDDTTFKAGLDHSKEGAKEGTRDAAITNPKKAVAAAHTAKQAKLAHDVSSNPDEGHKTEDAKADEEDKEDE